MSKWVIISVIGSMGVLTKDGRYSPNIADARLFDTEGEARAVAITIKTATVVQQLDGEINVPDTHNFPVPDYFEGVEDMMTVDELIWFIRQPNLKEHFTPVDNIMGANQMTGGGIEDPVTGRLIGREFQFSFARLLTDSDAETLGEAIRATGVWDYYNYRRKRLGFTSYAVLTLRSKNS